MAPCSHPLNALKFESLTTDPNQVTLRLACSHCGLPISKGFSTRTPQQAPGLQPIISNWQTFGANWTGDGSLPARAVHK